MSLIKSRQPKKNLVYTICFDAPGSEGYRFLGKMLASSLVRTFFTGDIIVFRNSPAPLFLVERKGLEEVFLETPEMYGQEGAEEAWCWKYRVAELIENPEQYDKILFLDCDSLALRNIDHLLEGDWDIRYQPERGNSVTTRKFNAFLTGEEMQTASLQEGANSGTIAVRGSIFHEVMEAWRDIDEGDTVRDTGFRDQASWNACLLRRSLQFSVGSFQSGMAEQRGTGVPPVELPGTGDAVGAVSADELALQKARKEERAAIRAGGKWVAEPFPAGEVQFPGYLDPHFASYRQAAITHNIMPDTLVKIEFTFGLYMRTFFCDPTGLFFSMLEM